MDTYYTIFLKKVTELGYKSYEEYLASPHWQSFRIRFFKSNRRKSCLCCELPNFEVELHHIDYSRLGKERLSDVISLCRYHHELIHQLLSDNYKGDVRCTLALVALLAPEKEDRPEPLHTPDNRKRGASLRRGRRFRGTDGDDFDADESE